MRLVLLADANDTESNRSDEPDGDTEDANADELDEIDELGSDDKRILSIRPLLTFFLTTTWCSLC